MRLGPAACFGGDAPTVTDAFNVLLNLNVGDSDASRARLETVAGRLNQPLEGLCESVADRVIEALVKSIQQMFRLWEDEPAYKVWEVVNRKRFVLHRVIGIGAAAPAIVPMLAQELGVDHFLHRYSPVANALGAALARPTLGVQVHVDTQNRVYTVSPGGLSGVIEGHELPDRGCEATGTPFFSEKIGAERGLSAYADEARVCLEEQFNIIRGWGLAGKLFDVGMEIAPGFVHGYEGVAR